MGTLEIDLQKKHTIHTISDTHFKKKKTHTHFHFIQSHDTIPHTTHYLPQDIQKHTKRFSSDYKNQKHQKNQSQNTRFYLGNRPPKKHTIHTISDTHFKKNTHTLISSSHMIPLL